MVLEYPVSMAKNGVTFASNIHFRPQAPKYCPILIYRENFRENICYTLLSSGVEVDLSHLAITLSKNDKICPKTEKKSM